MNNRNFANNLTSHEKFFDKSLIDIFSLGIRYTFSNSL